MTPVTLYLASASPRRKEILDQLGIDYKLLPQNIDETRITGEIPEDHVCRLARTKAESALLELDTNIEAACLGSDTTVVLKGDVFEKPVDEADAQRILTCLSGKTHQVLTAVALATSDLTQVLLSASKVTFKDLTDEEINKYWLTGEPADKAGAYGIQGLGGIFVKDIKGSYSGIMGLPILETVALLSTIGITSEQILEHYQ